MKLQAVVILGTLLMNLLSPPLLFAGDVHENGYTIVTLDVCRGASSSPLSSFSDDDLSDMLFINESLYACTPLLVLFSSRQCRNTPKPAVIVFPDEHPPKTRPCPLLTV